MMERGQRRAAGGGVAESGDERMAGEPAMQRVAKLPFPLAVHDAHRALAAQEGALHERLGRGARLVPAQAVQVGFRHVAARLGQEQQAFERVGAWSLRRHVRGSAFRKRAR